MPTQPSYQFINRNVNAVNLCTPDHPEVLPQYYHATVPIEALDCSTPLYLFLERRGISTIWDLHHHLNYLRSRSGLGVALTAELIDVLRAHAVQCEEELERNPEARRSGEFIYSNQVELFACANFRSNPHHLARLAAMRRTVRLHPAPAC